MRLYFLRHAEAVQGANDDIRPLSARGRAEAVLIAEFLKAAGVRFDAAYSSPLTRARETAEILLNLCRASPDVKLNTDAALRNETSQDAFNQWLLGLPEREHLLLVGHMPTIAAHTRYLLRMESDETLSFPTAGLACLDTPNHRQAQLVFFTTPGMLQSGRLSS